MVKILFLRESWFMLPYAKFGVRKFFLITSCISAQKNCPYDEYGCLEDFFEVSSFPIEGIAVKLTNQAFKFPSREGGRRESAGAGVCYASDKPRA